MLYSDHARAFRSWHVGDLTRSAPHWDEPPLTGGIVEPRLRRFGDHLKLRVERDAVSVSAEWDWESWDLLFTVQARMTRHDGFYACEHEPEDRSWPIERLWEEWLYEPLLGWAEVSLAPAAVLYFCRAERTHWATLSRDVLSVPEHAVYAVYDP